jgi:alpha-L-rhamnosidase
MSARLNIYSMLTDGRAEPLEVDNPAPEFSWKLRSADGGPHSPTGAAIVVERVDANARATVVWSTDVAADQNAVTYAGPPLERRSAYRWILSVAGEAGQSTLAIGRFETGMQSADEWSALWISRHPAPQFSAEGEPFAQSTTISRSFRTMYSTAPMRLWREFDCSRTVAKARLYASAHGVYRAEINGIRVGRDELTPGWTDYERRVQYQAYDVTELLRSGGNMIEATVADGWWSGYLGYNTRSQADQYGSDPEFIAELHILYTDGSTERVVTDGGWSQAEGEIAMADLLMGEYHDAARPLAPARPALEVDRTTATLSAQRADPVRALLEVAAVSVDVSAAGAVVVDFGQNLVGRVRLRLRGQEAGRPVELVHGEVLDGDAVYTANLRSAEARDVVVTSGEGTQVFEPLFTFHGFRFVQITGMSPPPAADDVIAVVLGSDLPQSGSFSSGNALVNQLQSNIVWGQRGNYLSVPTDCPQRDERLGWTADTQIFANTASYNSDVRAFLDSWLDDLAAIQGADGRVADIAPVPPTSRNFDEGAPGWGDAMVIVPWTLFENYGDEALLRRYYPHMRGWVDWVASRNPDGPWTNSLGNNYGDWLAVGAHTPRLLVAAAYQIRSVDLVARAAGVLGLDDEQREYRARAKRLREQFERGHVGEDARITGDTQSGYLFALAWDLVSPGIRSLVADRLVEAVERAGRRLTTGFLGANLICPVLQSIGRPDLALAILTQREFPSWGYTIDQGATTIWERWDGWTDHAGFQTIEMNSFNHYSLGSVGEWLYSSVAGIAQQSDSVGYERLLIAPLLAEELSPVSAWFESPRGRVDVRWEIADGQAELAIVVPPGVSAEVHFGEGIREVGPGQHWFSQPWS